MENMIIVTGAVSRRSALIAFSVCAVLAGCSEKEPEPVPEPPVPDVISVNRLSDAECLRKASLIVRNQGLTDEDLAQLDSGASLTTLIEGYLASEEFKEVVFDWYRGEYPTTQLTTDETDIEEPARIAAYIVNEGRDYRELVTGDYTVNAEGEAIVVEGQPAAGVLTTNHNMSAYVGAFRRQWSGHMIAQWSPYILEAVSLPPASEDSDVSPDTLAGNPGCAGCHVDPVVGVDNIATFATCYDDLGQYIPDCEEVPSTFLDKEGSGLQDFGQILAGSNEFKAVTINFFFRKLTGRQLAFDEGDFYARVASEFAENDYDAKELLKSMLVSEEFCSR